jgi:hypothetical protein
LSTAILSIAPGEDVTLGLEQQPISSLLHREARARVGVSLAPSLSRVLKPTVMDSFEHHTLLLATRARGTSGEPWSVLRLRTPDISLWIPRGAIVASGAEGTRGLILRGLSREPEIRLVGQTNEPFVLGLTPEQPRFAGHDTDVVIDVAASHLAAMGLGTVVSAGGMERECGPNDVLDMDGDLLLRIEWSAPMLPVLSVSGRMHRLRVNGADLVPTRWDALGDGVRGAVVGAIATALLGAVGAWLRRSWKGRRDAKTPTREPTRRWFGE